MITKVGNAIGAENFYGDYNFAKDDKNINGIMIFNLDTQDYYYTHRPLDIFPNCKDSFEKYDNYIKEIKNDKL